MTIINIHEAKTHLSKYIAEAIAGEEIIIAKSGTPIVRLMPYHKQKPKRTGGELRGMIYISEDFDAPLPAEIDKSFKGLGT